MNSRKTDDSAAENWLDRLEDAEFSEGNEDIERGILEPPIDSADVSELCQLLHSGESPTVRRKAARALGSLASSTAEYDVTRVLDELTRAVLTGGNAAVRAAAIDALYRHGSDRIDRLAGTMIEAIERGGDGAGPGAVFREWLGADHAEFRLVAAAAMETLGGGSFVSDLKAAFTDEDRRVQSRAIRTYGRIGEQVEIQPLAELLQSNDPMVRRAAASALGEIGTEAALESLLHAAKADDDRLRLIAVERLDRLDRRRSATVLADAVSDRSEAVRREAIQSLIELYTTGTAISPSDVRDRLLDGVSPAEAADLAELLADLLATDEREIDETRRETDRQAVWLLGETADLVERDDVHGRLVEALGHPDEPVAEIAAAYLRRLEGETLEAELRARSRDPAVAPEARRRAESVLDTIKRNVASEIREQDIEYTYIRRPADYTDKHG